MDEFTRRMVEEARKAPLTMDKMNIGTMVGQAAFDHISLDNVLFARVTEKDGKFWGDVAFDVPPGYPDMLGTPEKMPHDTREEAIQQIRGILATAKMAQSLRVPGEKKLQPIFELDHIAIEIPTEAVQRFTAVGALLAELGDDTLLQQIDYNVAEIAGDKPLDQEVWNAAPEIRKTILFGLMVMGLSRGIFRHRSAAMREELEAAEAPDPSK